MDQERGKNSGRTMITSDVTCGLVLTDLHFMNAHAYGDEGAALKRATATVYSHGYDLLTNSNKKQGQFVRQAWRDDILEPAQSRLTATESAPSGAQEGK